MDARGYVNNLEKLFPLSSPDVGIGE